MPTPSLSSWRSRCILCLFLSTYPLAFLHSLSDLILCTLYPCAYSILVVVAVKVHVSSHQHTLHSLIYYSLLTLSLYPCVYAILVLVLVVAVKLFALLAMRLNNFENHQTQTIFMNRLILKVFSFRFITVFTSLYYYAFCMGDPQGAYIRMSITIFALMTVGQWFDIIRSSLSFTPSLSPSSLLPPSSLYHHLKPSLVPSILVY